MKRLTAGSTWVAIGLLAGCGREPVAREKSTAPEPAPAAFAAAMPAGDPTPIPLARKQATPGGTLVIEGRIMGVAKPFSEELAVFVLGDEGTLTPCNARESDTCPTPWDVCCNTPEARRDGVATVQIPGSDGAVLRRGLKGVSGLRELSRVRVAGKAAAGSGPDALIVNAEAIRILDEAPKPASAGTTCPSCPEH